MSNLLMNLSISGCAGEFILRKISHTRIRNGHSFGMRSILLAILQKRRLLCWREIVPEFDCEPAGHARLFARFVQSNKAFIFLHSFAKSLRFLKSRELAIKTDIISVSYICEIDFWCLGKTRKRLLIRRHQIRPRNFPHINLSFRNFLIVCQAVHALRCIVATPLSGLASNRMWAHNTRRLTKLVLVYTNRRPNFLRSQLLQPLRFAIKN